MNPFPCPWTTVAASARLPPTAASPTTPTDPLLRRPVSLSRGSSGIPNTTSRSSPPRTLLRPRFAKSLVDRRPSNAATTSSLTKRRSDLDGDHPSPPFLLYPPKNGNLQTLALILKAPSPWLLAAQSPPTNPNPATSRTPTKISKFPINTSMTSHHLWSSSFKRNPSSNANPGLRTSPTTPVSATLRAPHTTHPSASSVVSISKKRSWGNEGSMSELIGGLPKSRKISMVVGCCDKDDCGGRRNQISISMAILFCKARSAGRPRGIWRHHETSTEPDPELFGQEGAKD